MSFFVFGLSHRSAPLNLLEKVTVADDEIDGLERRLSAHGHVSEAMVLSTCNRFEIYAEVNGFHGAVMELSQELVERTGVSREILAQHLYVHYEDRAIAHLYEVACGLDSMAVGEGQILGQIRSTLARNQERESVKSSLGTLLQHALHVGKRAHSETNLDKYGHSLVTAAYSFAPQSVGSFQDASMLVIGAGAMSSLAAVTAWRNGMTQQIVVANRTPENALNVVATTGGRVVGLEPETLFDEMVAADIVVSCTGSPEAVVTREQMVRVAEAREGKPQLLIDLAMPRDIEAAVGDLPSVTLVDLEVIGQTLAGQTGSHEVDAVREIVEQEVAQTVAQIRSEAVIPTVVALRKRANTIIEAELERLEGKIGGSLDENLKKEVANAVRRAVEKVVHEPSVRVKELAGTHSATGYAEALQQLFDLNVTQSASVEALPSPEMMQGFM